jgi:hypothetical protein
MTQNTVKIVLFKGWLLKKQLHLLHLKNICKKKHQGQKRPHVKIAGVLLNQAVKGLISQENW